MYEPRENLRVDSNIQKRVTKNWWVDMVWEKANWDSWLVRSLETAE